MINDYYGNTPESNFTLDFFRFVARETTQVSLAAPFFSSYEPIRELTEQGCEVNLIVRLCQITTPTAIGQALKDPLVKIRYFTSDKFHAKFYIADNVAMVGSANLTQAGLMSNRELSITLKRDEHPAFDVMPTIFSELWEYADVLTEEIFRKYSDAFNSPSRPKNDEALEKYLLDAVPPCDPPNVQVGSRNISGERLFLQNFRRRYDDMLVPAIDEIEKVVSNMGVRHPIFANTTMDIETSRFLGWMRLKHAPGESWRETPLLDQSERETRIKQYLGLWVDETDVAAGDLYSYEQEIESISKIRSVFASSETIDSAGADELMDALMGCHAFLEQLRFTRGGKDSLRKEFLEVNTEARIKETLTYLLRGPGDQIQRAYDCIFERRYKLHKFAESCVMELVGWLDPKRPPINGRTIKALRFLGFNAS